MYADKFFSDESYRLDKEKAIMATLLAHNGATYLQNLGEQPRSKQTIERVIKVGCGY